MGLAVGLMGALLLFSDLWGKQWSATLWGGEFDPRFLYWTFQWGYHALFEQWDWLGYYDANIFYPTEASLAFADPVLSAMVLFAPLRWLGVAPLSAIYLTLIGFCVAGAVFTDAALRRLGLGAAARALVVFAAHFSLPMISLIGTHYQLFGLQLAPAFLLYTFIYLRGFARRDLVIACALYLAGSLCAVYLAVMGALLAVALSLPLLVRGLRGRERPWLMARARDAAVVLLPAALLGYLLLGAPYRKMHDGGPPRPDAQYEVFAARFHSVVTDPTYASRWYAPAQYREGDREFACFPGWLLLAGALLGLGWLLWSRTPGRGGEPDGAQADRGPPRALWRYAGWLLLLSWVLSWGPFVEVDHVVVPSLFKALVGWFPGLQGVRAPGRFTAFFGLAMGLLAVAALGRLSTWDRRGVVTWLTLGLLVVESLPAFPTHPFRIPHAAFYRQAAAHITPGEPVLVLPAGHPEADRTFELLLDQLTGSTLHWGRLVPGYGSGQTRAYGRLVSVDREVQAGRLSAEGYYNLAASLGIRKVLIFPGQYRPVVRRRIMRYLERHQGARVLLRTDEGLLVAFKKLPAVVP